MPSSQPIHAAVVLLIIVFFVVLAVAFHPAGPPPRVLPDPEVIGQPTR